MSTKFYKLIDVEDINLSLLNLYHSLVHVSKTDDQMTARGGAKPKTSPMGPRFQRSISMQDTRSKTTTTSSITTTAGNTFICNFEKIKQEIIISLLICGLCSM